MTEKLRVLIVDDDQMLAKTLKDIIKAKGYDAECANSASKSLEILKETAFDCVITDVKMPEMDGVELYRAIKRVQPDIPVVLMTAYSADDRINEGLSEGALACLTKPLDIESLLRFFSLLHKDRSVVIIDDDPSFCKTLGDILQQHDFTVTQITEPDSIFKKIHSDTQVILLDMKINDIDGLEVLKKIRGKYPSIPVILVTGYAKEMEGSVEAALKISAYTYLQKPVQIEELLECLSEINNFKLSQTLDPSVVGKIKKGK